GILQCVTVAEVPAQVVVRCGSCGRVLDEDPGVPVETRKSCPGCGSTRRNVEIGLNATIHVTATLAIEIIRKAVIEKNWRWLAALVVLTVVSAVVGGLVVNGWVSVGVSLFVRSAPVRGRNECSDEG